MSPVAGWLRGPAWNALANLVRIASLFLLGRTIATQLGGEGLLALGQWQNLVGIGTVLGGNALQHGFQQGMAAHSDRAQWLGSGLLLGQILSFLACSLLLAARALGLVHFPSWGPAIPFLLLAACSLGSLQTNLQGATAGQERMGRLSLWLAVSGVLQVLLILPFATSLPRLGIGLLLAPALLGLFSLKALPFPRPRLSRLRHWLRLWLPFLSVGIAPGIASPLAQIALRQLAVGFDPTQAGLWQAATRLSDSVFPLWSAAAAAWILPRLARPQDRPTLLASMKVSLSGSLPLCLALMLFAPLALRLAFGAPFQGGAEILRWQCATELVRAVGLPFSLFLIARGRAWTFAGLEIASPLLQVGLSAFLLPRIGILALPIAAFCENAAFGLGAWWFGKADLRPT